MQLATPLYIHYNNLAPAVSERLRAASRAPALR